MSHVQINISSLKFIIFMLLLFVITAQGREVAKEEMVREELMIGSRPPRCERKWCYSSCGHCEAIQIPIGPQIHSHKTTRHFYDEFQANVLHSRGDDITNYKPMSWKCKCGNLIFNP